MLDKEKLKCHFNFFNLTIIVFIALLIGTLIFYEKIQEVADQFFTKEEQIVEDAPRLFIQGYHKADRAIRNINKELDSYNISTTYYNYYTPSGRFLDKNGEVLFSVDTVVAENTDTASENYIYNRNKLLSYLFGNSKQTDYPYGYSYLMRTSPNIDNHTSEYPDGNDIILGLDDFRQHQLYELFYLNDTRGGCIVQDLNTGTVRVFTTRYLNNSEQKDNMLALAPVIDPEQLFPGILTETESSLKQFLEIQSYSTVIKKEKAQEETSEESTEIDVSEPSETTELTEVYCFLTDFDVICESAVSEDYRISPLHLNSITQRIFSEKKSIPTFLETSSRQDFSCPCEELLPELRALYTKKDYSKEYGVTMQICTGSNNNYYYITGILSNIAKETYAFTLYGTNSMILKYLESIAIIYGDFDIESR